MTPPISYDFFTPQMTSTVKIYTHNKNEIFIHSPKGDIITSLQYEVVYQYKNYFTDTQKSLYKIIDSVPVLVSKLKKKVFKMIGNTKLYLVDVYGDVYLVEETNLRFVTGVLCTIKDVQIFEEKIFILDKYDRTRVCDGDGRIHDFKFNLKIHGFVTDNLSLKYITNSDDQSSDYLRVDGKIIKILSNFTKTAVLTDKFIYVYKDGRMNVSSSVEDILIGEDNEIYKIKDNQIKLI
jgi:hypothetical protein